jgi:hypothetical protein
MKLSNDNSNIDEWKAALERAKESTDRTELSQGGKAIWDDVAKKLKGKIPSGLLEQIPDASSIISKIKNLPGGSYIGSITQGRTALKGIPGLGTALSGIDILLALGRIAFDLKNLMQTAIINEGIPDLSIDDIPNPNAIMELANKYKDNPKAMGDLGFICCNVAGIIDSSTEVIQNAVDAGIDITSILPTGIFTIGAATGGSFALQAGQKKVAKSLSKPYTEIQKNIIKKINDKIVSLGGEVEEAQDENEEGETETETETETPPTPTPTE